MALDRWSTLAEGFAEAARQAGVAVLYEGLPHPLFEADLLADEGRTKAIQELNGYPFYKEPLPLTDADATRLSEVLSDIHTYEPFSGEKRCGGFHPDFAVEWRGETGPFRDLICFGCHEVKSIRPGFDSRDDLENSAYETLRDILKNYRRNRPSIR